MKTLLLLLALLAAADATAKGEEITFETSDGITVYGDVYRAPGNDMSAPLVLLFHQGGGDARGEYRPLLGRLLEAGFHALSIDQRRGGDRFGGVNRTAALLNDEDIGYCDAYPDIEGALDYAIQEGYTGPRIAWGSSYSAALAIRLGALRGDDLAMVLAFSPASGGPMAECISAAVSADLPVPLLALRPAREMEVPSVAAQLEVFREQGHATYVADPGVHGSSMLNAERAGGDTGATWDVVLGFIERNLAAYAQR